MQCLQGVANVAQVVEFEIRRIHRLKGNPDDQRLTIPVRHDHLRRNTFVDHAIEQLVRNVAFGELGAGGGPLIVDVQRTLRGAHLIDRGVEIIGCKGEVDLGAACIRYRLIDACRLALLHKVGAGESVRGERQHGGED